MENVRQENLLLGQIVDDLRTRCVSQQQRQEQPPPAANPNLRQTEDALLDMHATPVDLSGAAFPSEEELALALAALIVAISAVKNTPLYAACFYQIVSASSRNRVTSSMTTYQCICIHLSIPLVLVLL